MQPDPRQALVDEVNSRTEGDLEFIGVAEHGECGGAAFVRSPGGRQSVVTRAPLSWDEARRTQDVLELIKARGIPVPRHEQLVRLGDGDIAVVQERMPGKPASRVDVGVIEAILAMNERFAGLLEDRPDVPIPPLFLRESGPVFPRHEVLEGYSDRSRRLLKRIREVGAGEPHEMTGNDLVHKDLTVPNFLFGRHGNNDHRGDSGDLPDDTPGDSSGDVLGDITGVVDWNFGVARGDRRWSLVKLRFDLTWAALSPADQPETWAAIARVDAALDQLEPDLLKLYWAHWSLFQLHWAILGHSTEVIDLHLALGESRLG